MKDIGDVKYSKQYNDCEPKAVNATVVDEMNDMVADYNEKGASENLFNPYGDLESQIYAAGNKFDDRPGFSKITNRVPFVIVLLLATQIFSCFIAWYLVPRFRISEGVDIFLELGINYESLFVDHNYVSLFTHIFLPMNGIIYLIGIVVLLAFGPWIVKRIGSMWTIFLFFVPSMVFGVIDAVMLHSMNKDDGHYYCGTLVATIVIVVVGLLSSKDARYEKKSFIYELVINLICAIVCLIGITCQFALLCAAE